MISPSDYLSTPTSPYSRSLYYSDPSSHSSSFSTRIAPYLTTLINGAGWQPGYPRIMSNTDLDNLINRGAGQSKMVAVQDVACDLHGGLEFLDRHTTIDEPYWEGPGGLLISSTDILPTELRECLTTFHACLRVINRGRGMTTDSQLWMLQNTFHPRYSPTFNTLSVFRSPTSPK